MKSPFFLCVVFIVLGGCIATTHDWTDDPHLPFAAVKDHTYQLRQPMLAYRYWDDATGLWLVPEGTNVGGVGMPIAILPVGARIRIVKVVERITISGAWMDIYVSIEDGELAGKMALISDAGFVFSGAEYGMGRLPASRWTVNPAHLQSDDAGNESGS